MSVMKQNLTFRNVGWNVIALRQSQRYDSVSCALSVMLPEDFRAPRRRRM